MKNSKRKEAIGWFFLAALQLVWIVPCAYEATAPNAKEVVAESEEATESIRWKQDTEEVSILFEEIEWVTGTEVETEIETETEMGTEMEVKFFDVPLSEELQLHIFSECDKHNIAPAIVIAMIERESNYKADVLGDNGNSYGLMQIQPRWNAERMDKLGCQDLLDPFQNVTVGIDLLAELIDENPDLYWVLMSYNGGPEYADARMKSGKISDYAKWVVARASELNK